MDFSLSKLSIEVILKHLPGYTNYPGDFSYIKDKIENIHNLNINNILKKNMIDYLEKKFISEFIEYDDNKKGLIVERYVCNNNIENIKIFLKYFPNYVDIYNTSYFGETPLHNACFLNLFGMVKLLLKNYADTDAQDFEKSETPLMHASFSNDVDIANILLENGANPDLQNNYNETALHIACWRGHIEIVKLLLDYYANPNLESNFAINKTPISNAIKHGFTDIVKLLNEYQLYYKTHLYENN